MKTCYLIRHAKSSWDEPSLRDIDRPLDKRGKRDAPFMANIFKGKGIFPDRLISSPANRAFTTACHFAAALSIEENDIEKRKEIYEAYTNELLHLIQSLDEELNTVLLFGHNPGFTSLANQFATDYIANIPTCGIVCLQSEADHWSDLDSSNTTVSAFYFPKQYFS